MTEEFPPPLPPLFYLGLDQFNSGDYFVCHETLEGLWRREPGVVRQLYQGTIQIAVGCFHLVERANWVGAVRKLDEGARRIERTLPLLPVLAAGYGVDWPALIAGADKLQVHLREIGPQNIRDFDREMLPRVRYKKPGV